MKNSFIKDLSITMFALLSVGLFLWIFRWCAEASLGFWTDQPLMLWDFDVSLLVGVTASAFAAGFIVLKFVSRPRVWPGIAMIMFLAVALTFVIGRLRIYSMEVII